MDEDKSRSVNDGQARSLTSVEELLCVHYKIVLFIYIHREGRIIMRTLFCASVCDESIHHPICLHRPPVMSLVAQCLIEFMLKSNP